MKIKYAFVLLLHGLLASHAFAADTAGDRLNIGASNDLQSSTNSGAIGYGNILADYWDYGTSTSIDTSLLIGNGNSAVNSGSCLLTGNGNSVEGSGEVFISGDYNFAYAMSSIIAGKNNYAAGPMVSLFGQGLVGFGDWDTAPSITIIGNYNTIGAALSTTSLFVVGNGTDPDHRHNALEITQDGIVKIPKRQGDIVMGAFGNGNGD